MVRPVLPAQLHLRGRTLLSITLAGALLGAATGCSGSDASAEAANVPPPGNGETNPIAAAYQALEEADYGALPGLIERLDAEFESRPDQGRVAFYAGTMRLWLATGASRSPTETLNDVLVAIDKLKQARALRPEDAHVNAFLAVAQAILGATLRDEARIDEGRQLFLDSVRLYPPYVQGVRAQGLGVLPPDHPYYGEALEARDATLTDCGSSVSASGDFAITYPREDWNPQGTCWNEGIVQHVWEGIFLIYGDLTAKAGDAERARQLYGAAKLSPTFDRWPFAPELEARLEKAGERTALYQDGDPDNDPLIWVQEQHLCVGCHASRR